MYRYSSELLWSTLSQTNIHGEKLSKSRQKLISTHRVPLKWNILHVFVHSQSTAYALARHFVYVTIGMHGVFQTWTLSVSGEYSGLHPMRSRRICSMSALTISKLSDGLMRMPLKSTSGRVSICLFDLIFALNIRHILSLLLKTRMYCLKSSKNYTPASRPPADVKTVFRFI